MAEQVIDQGRAWWPKGLPGQESVQIYFNLAHTECPAGLRVEDYESREPFEVEVQFVQQGTGRWARYTGAILKFHKPEQRARPLRWTLLR
jgi:hypothetical protein